MSTVTDPVANSICTSGGTYFNFERPEESKFTIQDIAHALSQICRFTGHTRDFYSVAQHSYLVSYQVPHEHALAALLHDAAEAFIGDVSTPLKRMLPDYKAIEHRIETVVLARFGISLPLHHSIKAADLVLLATERRDLMPRLGDEWACLKGVQPMEQRLMAWSSDTARGMFMSRFDELTIVRGGAKNPYNNWAT